MASFGQDLKQEREVRNISLEEIADATKINLRFLQALEEDRLDILPGKFFTRGILRSYAKHIGLNENDVLNRYQGSVHAPDVPEEKPEEPLEIEVPEEVVENRRARRFVFIAFFILAVAIPLVIILQRGTPEPAAPPPEKKPAVQPIIAEKPPPKPEPSAPEPEPQDLTLEFNCLQETWLQIFVDGERIVNGLMPAGHRSEVKANEVLLITTGNAGGIAFTLNGREGLPLGNPGQVRNEIRITMDNWRDFVKPDDSAGEDPVRAP